MNDHHEYGFDPTLEYVDVYIPQVAQGMNVRVGRYISVPGIEAQLAPNNYIFSHSLLYAIDPFTDTGLIATVKLKRPVAGATRDYGRSRRCLVDSGCEAFRYVLPELYD